MSEELPPGEQPPQPSEAMPPPAAPNNVPPAMPPAWNLSPGYAPPPGYGMQQPPPPSGYPVYPQGAFYQPGYQQQVYAPPPVPREYAVPPPVPGYPWQVVPPAQGTLFQAWLSIGRNLSRQNIASWAQARKPGWTRTSIGVYLAFSMVPLIVLAGILFVVLPSFVQNVAATSNPPFSLSSADVQQIQTVAIVVAMLMVILVPVLALASMFGYIWFLALFMPSELGTVRERMRRAITPYALTLPVAGAVSFLLNIATFIFLAFALSNFNASNPSSISTFAAFSPILNVLSIGVSVYAICLFLQSGSVGTTLSRWAVFGINLLWGFAVGVVFIILGIIIFVIVGSVASHTSSWHLLWPLRV